MKLVTVLLAVAGLLVLGACNPCKPGAQRCKGSIVEICRPDKTWSQVQDCDKLKRTKQAFKCTCLTEKNKCYCKVQKGGK